jgi:hypothetical protein
MTFVKRMAGLTALGVGMLIGSGLAATPAEAGYVVTLEQVASNVVATGSGPIDLTGLASRGRVTDTTAEIVPGVGDIATGPTFSLNDDLYTGFTGPTSFGSGGRTFADSGSGDSVGIANFSLLIDVPVVIVPPGYVSGSPLSDTSTYDNQTLNTLGATPGTYEWTWGSGVNQNFTVQVGPVPEPSSLLLFGVALAALPLVRTRRRIQASGLDSRIPPKILN